MGFFDWFTSNDDDTHRPHSKRKCRSNKPANHPIKSIEKEALQLIIESARHAHPNEFAGALRAPHDTIEEIVIVPGTVQGATHAILKMNELPPDPYVVGTVHSHPSRTARPSQEDLQLFGQNGHTHIIIHEPYTRDTWRCWNHRGEPVDLRVI